MSIVRTIRSKARRSNRELARAVALAPTRASREELLTLAYLGR